eukprot:7495896-Prorocentrum_lima.AAC.1
MCRCAEEGLEAVYCVPKIVARHGEWPGRQREEWSTLDLPDQHHWDEVAGLERWTMGQPVARGPNVG